MIWLASFPRSGNTFFRNVLYEVYGISSSTYHQDPSRELDENFRNYPVIKTHLLPKDLPEDIRNQPAVYLIRDGRDALVSIAHHRKDIVAPGSDFYNNLLEAILAQGGSFFGGWSENVRQWTAKADIIIRFEDLIRDPIKEIEKLRTIMPLPEADPEKLPAFQDLKFGQPKYGAGTGKQFNRKSAQLNFRKGKVGGWKEELPVELEKLIWAEHGAMLEKWNFEPSNFNFDQPKKRVLIEASKLYSPDNDGIKRYLTELIGGLSIVLQYLPDWQVELYDRKSIQPILKTPEQPDPDESNLEFRAMGDKEAILKDRRTMGYEKILLLFKNFVKKNTPASLYGILANFYKKGPFRSLLPIIKLKVTRLVFKKREDEIFAAVRQADLVHIPLPQHLTEVGENHKQLLVTVHDLTHQLFSEYHTQNNIKLSQEGMKVLQDKNAHVLSVSKSTMADLQRSYAIPIDRLHLCYEAANSSIFNPEKREENITWLKKKYNIPDEPYLMCLSTIEPRKNLKNTILAFQKMKKDHPSVVGSLVICGKMGWKTSGIFEEVDLNDPNLFFTGFVDDIHLPYLYAHARALCYISHYEGFGLPILEAMNCKTPVIFGNNSSMPEVAGKGGLPADSNDINDIKEQMYRILTDDVLWNEKSIAAWQQACRFSWLKTAVETLAIYEKIIEENK